MADKSVHISDVRRFKECRQLWHYQSPLRLNLAPRTTPTYFLFGRLVHDALEQWYINGKDVRKAYERAMINELRSMRRQYPEFAGSDDDIDLQAQLEVGKHVAHHYTQWAKAHDDFEMVHPELKFQDVPLPGLDGVTVSGRFDGKIRRKNGSLWLKEFKTAATLPSDFSFLLLDEQASLYLWAVNQEADEPIAGILYTYLRKKAPTIPRLLKRGGLSKASNIATTVIVYYNTLLHYDLNPHDYADFLKFLAAKPNIFFTRYQVRRTKRELEIFIQRLVETAKQMLDPDVPIYPSPSMMNCNRCSFFGACSISASNPGMEEAILKAEFKKNIWR